MALLGFSCQDVDMLTPAADLLAPLPAGTCIAAFNVITLEHAEGIARAAEATGRPAILQLSENAIRYHGGPEAIAAAMVAVARTSTAPLALHLDHITDAALARRTAELGFSSVMFDGATLPYAENVAATAAVAAWGSDHGVWIEAELGEIGGKDGAHAPGVRTDPDEALRFVTETGVQSLAVAVGSSHAMTDRTAQLDLALIERICAALPVPLVLHGSSGVPDDVLRAAAAAGMRKINIGTALNQGFTGAVRAWIAGNDGSDPRRYLTLGREAVTSTAGHFLDLLRPMTP